MMKTDRKTASRAIGFQWDFYERFLSLYSILSKLMEVIEKKEKKAEKISEILVEETNFDTCYTVLFENETVNEGFYSLLEKKKDIDLDTVRALNKGAFSASTFFNTLGYGVLYIHPLVFDFDIKGFIVLGKKEEAEKEKLGIKELELVLRIFNRFFSVFSFSEREVDITKHLPFALFVLDRNGTILQVNEKANEILSPFFKISEGMKIKEIFTDFDMSLLQEEGPSFGEVTFKAPEGQKVYELQIYPIKDKEKTILKGVIVRDISHIKALEEETLYREKMETLGMLSAGVAHDFNNLLTGILGYASMLKTSLSGDEKLVKYAEVIERSAMRASNLTKHLLNFSKRHKKPAMEFDLHAVLDDSLFLIGESFRRITVQKKYEPLQFLINGDESEFQHVFLNLFMNAKDAMEGRGTLTVETKKVTIQGVDFVRVMIEDTGKGMDSETLEKLFKPHFTTKTYGVHLGIGLHRVEKTIKKYGGFIEVESEKEKGTRFYLYIPICGHKLGARINHSAVSHKEEIKKERKSILVVDDEDFICEMFKHVLSERFEVFCCTNGEEALSEIEKRDFDIVVLDIIMPGIKGDEVLRKIREAKKGVKVIISSGYMSEEQREKIKKMNVQAFLDKPFTEEAIIRTIDELISQEKMA